jgi:hypothetical protein
MIRQGDMVGFAMMKVHDLVARGGIMPKSWINEELDVASLKLRVSRRCGDWAESDRNLANSKIPAPKITNPVLQARKTTRFFLTSGDLQKSDRELIGILASVSRWAL